MPRKPLSNYTDELASIRKHRADLDLKESEVFSKLSALYGKIVVDAGGIALAKDDLAKLIKLAVRLTPELIFSKFSEYCHEDQNLSVPTIRQSRKLSTGASTAVGSL